LGGVKDELIYEEKDELYRVTVHRSRDRAYYFATSASSTSSEVRFLPSDRLTGPWRLLSPREPDHEYDVDHRDGLFYIRTNKDARNFRLVTAPVDDPRPANWKELVPHRKDVLLRSVDLFAHHCVTAERENGLQQLAILDLRTGQSHRVAFPE